VELRSPSGQEEKKKRKGKTVSISILTFWGYPCTYGAPVEVLILAVRISLGCEEDKMAGGVSK
jgi:hypothetical protein